jgi:membrane protease YdiL (CAAX protease family)
VSAFLGQSFFFLVWLAAGLLAYGALADRALFAHAGRERVRFFGPLDLFIASTIGFLFLALILGNWDQVAHPPEANPKLPGAAATIANVAVSTLVFGVVIGGILVSLQTRGISWNQVFGFNRLSAGGILIRAALLIALALPLIYGALALCRALLAAGGDDANSSQELVRFLAKSPSEVAKCVVVLSAVILAPLQEEFIFRGYLYGVARRYGGAGLGLLVNATLFAGIHLHAPSFGGLFVLAACLTLAYEWTGCLLVPMAMHALFNSLSIFSLLAGGHAHR